VIRAWVISPYRVPSSSMEPTLHCSRPSPGCRASQSDRLLVGRFIYAFRSPHRGEIVVFEAPARAGRVCGRGIYVKRIIGLPGEVVSEQAGVIYINGRRLKEPYIAANLRDALSHVWPRLGQGHYFVLGDNRRDSCDSRWWGPVPRRNVIGPVIARYWPLARVSIGGP
jgi:signal peptidase I